METRERTAVLIPAEEVATMLGVSERTLWRLLSAGKLQARSFAYQGMNLAGAIAFVVNSGWNGAIPSAALNVVWAFIALFALTRIRRART